MMRAGSPGEHVGRRAVVGGRGRAGLWAVGLTQPDGTACPGPCWLDSWAPLSGAEEQQHLPICVRGRGGRRSPGTGQGRAPCSHSQGSGVSADLGPGSAAPGTLGLWEWASQSPSGSRLAHRRRPGAWGFPAGLGAPAAPSPAHPEPPTLVSCTSPPPEGSGQAAPVNRRLRPEPVGGRVDAGGRRPLPTDHPRPPGRPRVPCPTHPSSHGSPAASSATRMSYSSAAYFSQSDSSGPSLSLSCTKHVRHAARRGRRPTRSSPHSP